MRAQCAQREALGRERHRALWQWRYQAIAAAVSRRSELVGGRDARADLRPRTRRALLVHLALGALREDHFELQHDPAGLGAAIGVCRFLHQRIHEFTGRFLAVRGLQT